MTTLTELKNAGMPAEYLAVFDAALDLFTLATGPTPSPSGIFTAFERHADVIATDLPAGAPQGIGCWVATALSLQAQLREIYLTAASQIKMHRMIYAEHCEQQKAVIAAAREKVSIAQKVLADAEAVKAAEITPAIRLFFEVLPEPR